MADSKDVVPKGEIAADATAAEDSRSIEKTDAEGRVKQERQGNDTEKTETVTESAVTQSLQEKEIEHVKDLAIEEKGSGEQRESGTKDRNEKETPKFTYDAELMMKNIYQDTEVQVDPATIQLMTDGFVTRFLPSLEKARSSIGQIKSIQTVLIETVQQETAKFNECQGYAELEEKMIKARQYHNKLLRLKKEMINLSEKSKKLKKRAVKLQQQKQKEELERAHDQEKEYEKERMLQARVATSSE